MKVQVGNRYRKEMNQPWIDGPEKGNQAEFKTVEVIEESGHPRFGGNPINVTGGFYIPLWKQEPIALVLL